MQWALEVVVVPVSDVDRAKAFYADRLGFNVDHDTRIGEGQRIVQLTPPGSGCPIQVLGENPTPQPDPLDNVGFVFFGDPDGNGWGVQQISARGRSA
jgi:catechol 2,3-dioxygenase-like lactoylglutathione lyase family enzyme